jgi:hypothetical protein
LTKNDKRTTYRSSGPGEAVHYLYSIYIGTNYPNDGGELIETNSASENKVISLLKEIIDSNLNPEQQKNLNRVETRDGLDINMPLEDYKAAIVLIEIQHYKRAFHNMND